jgi:transketolase
VLNAIASHVPWLLGGAADLAPSTKTALIVDFAGTFEPASSAGRNFHFGIREHAMCAVASGMALSGLRAYASTFLVFTDYARGAIRLAAMMGLPVTSGRTTPSRWARTDPRTNRSSNWRPFGPRPAW